VYLNWANLSGLLLGALCLISVPSAAFQIWFLLTRRADTTPQVLISTILRFATGLGRLIGLPVAALTLFFQGWRLDPSLQFAVLLLSVGLILESISGIVVDYNGWRARTGRATAVIPVAEQPSDDA
jgi:hypothetical protein